MKVIEADKVVPLCRLLLFGNPEADEIAHEMQCVVDSLSVDATPVVRCRDCKAYGHHLGSGKHACLIMQLPYCKPDDYCSYGVRKETNT